MGAGGALLSLGCSRSATRHSCSWHGRRRRRGQRQRCCDAHRRPVERAAGAHGAAQPNPRPGPRRPRRARARPTTTAAARRRRCDRSAGRRWAQHARRAGGPGAGSGGRAPDAHAAACGRHARLPARAGDHPVHGRRGRVAGAAPHPRGPRGGDGGDRGRRALGAGVARGAAAPPAGEEARRGRGVAGPLRHAARMPAAWCFACSSVWRPHLPTYITTVRCRQALAHSLL
jgi:hypothetical protein